jgi:hypothetical protein
MGMLCHCRHASAVPHQHRRLAASTSSSPSAPRIATATRGRSLAHARSQLNRRQDRCHCRNIRSLRHSGSITAREHPPTSVTYPVGEAALRGQCGQSMWRSASSLVANSVAPMLLRRAGMSHARSQPLKLDRAEHQCSVDIDRRRPNCRSHQHQCQRRHNAQTHAVICNDVRQRAASVQRQHQDQTSSPLSRSATHLSLAASRAATHSNRLTRIDAHQLCCITCSCRIARIDAQ